MDSFEHLLDGGELLLELLRCAPGLQILATSREPLYLQEEQIYLIQGLPFPHEDMADDQVSLEIVF